MCACDAYHALAILINFYYICNILGNNSVIVFVEVSFTVNQYIQAYTLG